LILENRKNGYTGDGEARIANLRGLPKWVTLASQQFDSQLPVIRIRSGENLPEELEAAIFMPA